MNGFESPVGTLLHLWAWITLVAGMLGGLGVAWGMSEGAGQFWLFWIGISAASVTWFLVLHGLGEIVEAANLYRERQEHENPRMVR